MEKVRVYELAKELNTTSKRLMEKLAEINVVVKNHMSLLEDDELNALYKHIGVIKHVDKKTESEEKKAPPAAPLQQKPEPRKDTKSAPRIIRTTEIIINSKNETNTAPTRNDFQRGDVRGARNDSRRDFIRSSDDNSGLRAGFVRDSRPDYMKEAGRLQDRRNSQEAASRETVKPTGHQAAKTPPVKPDTPVLHKERDNTVELNHDATVQEQVKDRIKTVTEETTAARKEENVVTRADDMTKAINEKTETANTHQEKPAVQTETGAENKPAARETEGRDTAQAYEKPDRSDDKAQNPEQQSKPQSDRPQSDKPQSDRPQSDRPQGDRPQGDRTYGDRPYGNRPQGDRPYGNRPQGDRPYGNRPQGDRPYGNRPQGDRPYGDRPQGDRPYGNRPQGDRPYGNRPQGDRPYGDRPQGDRPYGNRPQGDRPYGDRPQGDRPYGNRPQGDRPYGDRPQGDRPYGNRPQGDRPYGNRPQGDRPYGNRPQGDRPYGDRPQGDRPYGNRPQGDRPYGNRPQGDRPYGNRPQGDRPYGNRPQGNRPLDIPKPDLTLAQKEELGSQRSEIRREFSNKDMDKDVKREQKKEAPRTQPAVKGNNNNKRFKPTNIAFAEKKGVSEVLSEDYILNEFYNEADAKKKKQNKNRRDREAQRYIPQRAVLTSIKIPESITVKDLAEALKKTATEVIKKLMGYGMMATLNQEVDFDTATVVAEEFGVKTEKEVVVNEEDILFDDTEEDPDKLVPRPPVVVVMGHVDHGKTSLLDAIRSTHVIETEAGGITQHIGAYTVNIHDRNITFLDTPGHEAFTAMRARGAQVTDVVILVVAADDGVMPQTIEAINHAKAAKVSIIVAINKIDKPGANPDKVKQELMQYGLVSEEWGGDVICVNVSAKKRENISQLLEMVLLTADMLELKANPDRQAKGTVIEAKLDKSRGPLATVLVQRGTLNVGDSIVTGTTVGRIRAMVDDKGNAAKSAGPSTPVEILGLPEVPEAGELFYAIQDEKVARHLAEKRKLKLKQETMKATAKVSLEDLYKQIQEGKIKDLNLIVRADVQGSVEAVKQSLEKLSNDEVRVNIIQGAVGAITESDVVLAGVSNAIIIGFNVRPGANVTEAAENAGVDIKLYRVIYNAIEDIEAAMKGMLEPTFKEVVIGHTEVRQIFKVSGVGTIAGCYVLDGKINRNSDIRVIRDGIVVHEGKLASLKRFKDDAKEVMQGFECGLSVERFNDIREKDVIEAYVMEEVAR